MSAQRHIPRRTLLLALALLLALMPVAALAVWTPLADFFGTTSSATQITSGGTYTLDAGLTISAEGLAGGGYTLDAQVDGLLPEPEATVEPPQGPRIYLPVITSPR